MERSRKKKIIVAFYGFLILMWLCTVISKSIYTSKLPVVSTETLQAKYIEHTVETEGIVVAGDKSPVNVLPGLRVDGIAVQAGDTVEEGDVILQADLADLDDYIKTQQTQIDKLQAQIDVLLQNRELAQQEKALEEQRAREDYDALARREDTLVGRSDEAYSQAAYELEQYRREMAAQESSPDEDEEEAARKAKEAEAQEAALVDELQQAAYAQADAKWQRDQAMQEAQRKVEDILSPDGEDAAMEVYRLEMAELQDGLEQYRALRDEEGQIRADRGGLITDICIGVGERTSDTPVILVADSGAPCRFQTAISEEQKKYVGLHDAVTVRLDGSSAELELTADSIAPGGSGGYDLGVTLPEGSGTPGLTGTMKCVRTGERYYAVVTSAAVHTENNRSYVYVVKEREGILGQEYYAQQVNVTVLDQNDNLIALECSLSSDDMIITSATKEFKNGDVVRPETLSLFEIK